MQKTPSYIRANTATYFLSFSRSNKWGRKEYMSFELFRHTQKKGNQIWATSACSVEFSGAYPASQQQPGAVGCSVVRQAYSYPIFGQLVGVCSTHYLVSLDLCIGDLDKTETEDSGSDPFQHASSWVSLVLQTLT